MLKINFKKLIFLVLITACVAGVSGCVRKETAKPVVKNNQQVNKNTNTTQDHEMVENGEEIDTSDWLTYRNEEYGFEVKYPGEWEVLKKKYQTIYRVNFINKAVDNANFTINIDLERNKNKLDIKEWFNKYIDESGYDKEEDLYLSKEIIEINKNDGIKIIIQEIGKNAHYYFTKNGIIFELIYPTEENIYLPIYKLIVESFMLI